MRKLNQRGSFLVFLTLGFALVGTFIGFAVDFGRAYLEKARVARLIDGAALAAAKVLKGQVGFESQATRAACDSMLMNGAQVAMTSATTCSTTSGAPVTATISFFDLAVPAGPPLRAVRIVGTEPVPTTFLRFLGWMAPGDYSTINVVAQAEAGPERPIDLMLVLDRSGSMGPSGGRDAIGKYKIESLKTAVNAFLGLQNTFSANDRIGITSFASRGCGIGGQDTSDTTPNNCPPDKAMDFTTSSYISQLQAAVTGLCGGGTNCTGGTNTMEALRSARVPLAATYNDPARALTRKAVLLVTDGQPTFMRRDSASDCNTNPVGGTALPSPGNTGGPAAGCIHGVPSWTNTSQNNFMYRGSLNTPGTLTPIPSTSGTPGNNPTLYRNVISCTRSITTNGAVNCVTKGAMHEANQLRNCGFNNPGCGAGGQHDVVFFAIGIGQPLANSPQGSFDNNAKCLLARMANAEQIVNANSGITETLSGVCATQIPTIDGDNHADLNQGWPACASGSAPCIDPTQEKGKVYIIDPTGNVTAQLNLVFQEIAQILKLRLVL